jgi:hypothetical protein
LVDTVPLSPPDDFTAVPYALVAGTATSVSATGVSLANGQNLSSWQSITNGHPDLIDPAKLDGTQTSVATGLVPTGAIILWDQSSSCPSGYIRVTALDGLFPRGAATPGGTGGAATHSHDISHNHSVSVDPHSHAMPHTHATGTTTNYSDYHWVNNSLPYPMLLSYVTANHDGERSSNLAAYNHTHGDTGQPSIPTTSNATATGSTVSISTTTSGPASNIPPYYDVLFCRKQ